MLLSAGYAIGGDGIVDAAEGRGAYVGNGKAVCDRLSQKGIERSEVSGRGSILEELAFEQHLQEEAAIAIAV